MADRNMPSIVFVSTYPPTRCGIASYTASLVRTMAEGEPGRGPDIVRLLPRGDVSVCLDPEVLAEAEPELGLLNLRLPWRDFQLGWIQHEYGIFGARDGEAVLEFVESIPVPVVATLHTVLASPTPWQRYIMEELLSMAAAVVVLSDSARVRLVGSYGKVPARVEVIPHGAIEIPHVPLPAGQRPTIVTWGLLGPGKGHDAAILAMNHLRHLDPLPRLIIAGATHPNVKRMQGETYRDRLRAMVRYLHLDSMVEIRDGYMTHLQLVELTRSATAAVLPYESSEQVTSGVLTDALAAGLPVVATAFPHAVELLARGAGMVVPHGQPRLIARALERFLADPQAVRQASTAARQMARRFRWSAVARDHERLARRVVAERDSVVA